jgi:hypothetical protein
MIDRLCAIARALTLISLLAVTGAQANGTVANVVPAGAAGSKSPAQATGQPDKPAGLRSILLKLLRANKTVGVDIRRGSLGSGALA